MNFFDPDLKDALHTWWSTLHDHRGDRALLRRCHELADVEKAYSILRHRAPFRDLPISGVHERVAAVAGLLARVEADAPETVSLAQQMAEPLGGGGRPIVSEVRFQRLLRLDSLRALYPQMIRILRLLDGHASVVTLAQDVSFWNRRVRQNWAGHYYGQLLQHERVVFAVQTEHLPSWALTHAAITVDGKAASFDPAKLGSAGQRIQLAALAWWSQAKEHYGGELAELRRCSTLGEVRLLKGYHRMRWYTSQAGLQVRDNSLAVVAGVLAHVQAGRGHDSFAMQLALPVTYAADPEKKRPNKFDGKPRISDLRFRRLLQIEEHNDLFRALIRAVHCLGRTVNVPSLAAGAYYWGDRTRRAWANDYYSVEFKKTA